MSTPAKILSPAKAAEKKLIKDVKTDRRNATSWAQDHIKIPALLHHDLVERLEKFDDADLDFLLPDYFRPLLPQIKNLVTALEAGLPRDEGGELIPWYSQPEPTKEQIEKLVPVARAQRIRSEAASAKYQARREAQSAWHEMRKEKLEAWKAAHPGEHYPGDVKYGLDDDGDEDWSTVLIEADETADERLLGIKPFYFPGDEEEEDEAVA